MAVSITWSSTAGGTGVSSVAHGTSVNGTNTVAQQLFIRHNGLNPITACAFYFAQKSGIYTGAATAADDFTELLGWGASSAASDFGGVQVNMDAEGSFFGGPTWGLSETQKSSVDGLKFTARTGVADSTSNAIILSEKMSTSMSTNGVIPVGVQDASFKIRITVPTSESTAGVRQFDQILKFSYTS